MPPAGLDRRMRYNPRGDHHEGVIVAEAVDSAPAIAALLLSRLDEASSRWLDAVHRQSRNRYRDLPRDELAAIPRRGITAIAEALGSGSDSHVDAFLADIARARMRQGFSIGQVIDGLLLLREAALPVLAEAAPPGSLEGYENTARFERLVRYMLSRFSELFAEAMQQESQALQRVTAALLEKADLGEVLDIVCAEARQLVGAEGSAVFLLEEDEFGGEGWLRVARSSAVAWWPSYDGLPLERSFTGMVVRTGKARLTNDPSGEPRRVKGAVEPSSLLVAPLIVKGVPIGALDLVNKPGGFTDEDLRMIGLFADQAAIAIENARLRQRIEQLAVVEERQRLARELHDSVNQSLYSIGLFAEAVGGLIAAGNFDKALDYLHQLRVSAHEALKEMRLLIFELRPPALEQEGLVGALQARLDSVETRGGLQCKLLVEGDERLPAAIEDGLYRIALEALNNVLKHAHARRVTVQLRLADGLACLEVSDDGDGFSAEAARRKGGLGLKSMAERAQHIGAQFKVQSEPGKGTTVIVEVASTPKKTTSSGGQEAGR